MSHVTRDDNRVHALGIGRAIAVCRVAHGWSQDQLATRIGIGSSQISLIEAGKRSPSFDVFNELADAFEIPPHALMALAHPPDGDDNAMVGAVLRSQIQAGLVD